MIIANNQVAISRSKLNIIPVTKKETKTFKGVNHGKLATTVVKRVEKAGLEIVGEQWYVNPKRTILWGAVDIKPGGVAPGLEIGQDANFSMGIRHGNGGEYAVSFAVGARIGVCSNGMFSGDFVVKHRHRPNLDLDDVVDQAIERYIQECEVLEKLINGWRDTDITDRDAAYLILKAHRDGYANFQHLELVEQYWTKPIHDEFEPRTAWSLYNAFTEMAKDRMTPPRQLKLLTGLRKMFDAEFGVGDAYVGTQTMDIE